MDELIYFGNEIKALGDGKVAGFLVTFGDETKTDLVRDFFRADTDYDVDFEGEVKSTVYYHHGLDPVLGRKKLGNGVKATLTKKDAGIWAEAQLDMSNEYESAIYNLVEQKKMGWSSGTAAYLVEREQVGNAHFIKRWALGVDASITPTPAEYRNRVVAMKSVSSLPALKAMQDGAESMLGDDLQECLTFSMISQLNDRFLYRGLWSVIYSEILTPEQKKEKIFEGFDELATKGKKVAEVLLSLNFDEQNEEYKKAKELYFAEPSEKKFNTLQKHSKYVMDMVKTYLTTLETAKEFSAMKIGATFNQKNSEYIKEISTGLLEYGQGLADMIGVNESSAEVKTVNHAVAEFTALQSQLR